LLHDLLLELCLVEEPHLIVKVVVNRGWHVANVSRVVRGRHESRGQHSTNLSRALTLKGNGRYADLVIDFGGSALGMREANVPKGELSVEGDVAEEVQTVIAFEDAGLGDCHECEHAKNEDQVLLQLEVGQHVAAIAQHWVLF